MGIVAPEAGPTAPRRRKLSVSQDQRHGDDIAFLLLFLGPPGRLLLFGLDDVFRNRKACAFRVNEYAGSRAGSATSSTFLPLRMSVKVSISAVMPRDCNMY